MSAQRSGWPSSLSRVAGSAHFWQSNASLVIRIVFVVFAAILTNGALLRPSNVATILYQTSTVGVLAMGQALVVIAGGIDLSVVSILILTAVIMGGAGSERQAQLMLNGMLPFIGFCPALLLGFAVATLTGFVNGIIITRLQIPAFITTLATALLLGGAILLTTGGSPIYYPNPFYANFGLTSILGIQAPVYVFAAVTLICAWLLKQTAFGKKLYAIGGSERAARYSGIPVERIRLIVYTMSGLFAGIAGFIFLSRAGYISYASGGNLLLTTIAAVVVGGVSLAGGSGGAKHVLVGVLFLAVLGNFMNIVLISPHVQYAVNGAVILIAVSLYGRLRHSAE
jgi:ribose/xylose/arabinose/galactoside ABC-type transport system permease subunit